MAASSGTGMVDPTKPAKYPVILSDELLGKGSREMFTGVRYNHRPTDEAPSSARIKASTPGSGTFDLAFHDAEGSKYGYNGRRAADDNQFVLVFDPNRKAFVLHRLDSLFHMNLVSTPTNDDAASLKEQHPHLTGHSVPTPARGGDKKAKPASKGATSVLRANNTKKKAPVDKKDDGGAAKPAKKKETSAKKPSAASQKKNQNLADSLPMPSESTEPAATEKKKAPPPPQKHDDDSEDEDDDSDGDDGLTIEYPGGKAPDARPRTDFSPAFQPTIRRFDDFVKENGTAEEDEDADAEADFEDDFVDVDVAGGAGTAAAEPPAPDAPADDDFDDLEGDLEAALEQELQGSGMDVDEESDISEED